MSENESGMKRTTIEQDTSPTESDNNKKLKLSNEVVASLPILSNNTLILDKLQQDTINQLVQSSSASILNETVEPRLTEDANKIMESEIVSADIEKAVTEATPETIAPSETEKTTSIDDLNITSEQLLFALTSIPPTETAASSSVTALTAEGPKETEPTTVDIATLMQMDETVIDKSVIVKELLALNPLQQALATQPAPEVKASSPLVIPPATTTGLGITPNKPTAQSLPQSNNNNITASTIPPQLKTANNNNNNQNSPSLTNALTNLPDISAALRRLSSHTVPASVIEQLSSSPRLPNIGHLHPNNNNERRASMADVSPSEILGNALAAVAANASAASRSSPKQPQPTQSNAATAIGNLAAITANISNLLHSGGFHRNSFSQEDLAAAVAVARHSGTTQQQQPQQRRKSSMATLSTMLDQAMLMNRKSIDKSHPPAQQQKPKLIIKNEQVWKCLEGVEEKNLGFQLYSPQLVLPNLENSLNGVMEIRVPARYLTFENTCVKKRAAWGTDIYTDDSDIVTMAIHSGNYLPRFIEPDIEAGDPFALAVSGKQRESMEAAKKLALSGKKWIRHDHNLIPDHDLKVIVRVLPTLQNYASSIRYRIKSREWGKHDGMSLFVIKVEKIKRGDARLRGRSAIKSSMFVYEQYRKQALGLTTSQQEKLSIPKDIVDNENLISDNKAITIQKGRVKRTPRVMRMFQIRAEMLNNEK